MTDETTETAAVIPCILECGYEEVWIEKSGRSFPAWKVAFETGAWWRSKFDFLLLSRQSSVPLPKAAFHKLAQESPWQRPDTHQVERDINHWKPHMKKSLFVLDQYLLTMQRNHPQAWSQFCRPCDAENLCKEDRVDHNQSKQWGQYFSSKDNAQKLVEVLMETLDTQNIDWVIEPSCGHGTILQALIEENENQEMKWKIMGIDIDQKVVSHCREQHALNPRMKHIHWEVADFLNSRKSDFGINESEQCAVIGNPPFHQARQFVQHAMTEYNARVVVFIMPKRCCSGDDDCGYDADYECKNIQMKSCDFHFQGNTSQTIKQPSSIQCFWRRKE